MLKTYTPQELADILELHRKWLDDSTEGRRADLQDADLQGAYLQGAYLQGANLQDTNLQGAYLRGANLQDTNLQDAYLRGANLQGANLQGAYLRGANLQGANLQGAKADKNTRLPAFLIVPQMGEFIAWKNAGGAIVQIAIPADARRCSTPTGRKCRAEFVRVLSIDGDTTPGKSIAGDHDRNTIYTVGKITRADKYDDDWRVECTHGIHFFITREEAEEY